MNETDWHIKMHKAIKDIAIEHNLKSTHILAFLTATLTGQFALAGLNEKKVKNTLERMFCNYLTIKQRDYPTEYSG